MATALIVRGLIALRDTRSPLISNSLQLGLRAALIAVLLGPLDVLAIPVAFAVSAAVETVGLGALLWLKVRRRLDHVLGAAVG